MTKVGIERSQQTGKLNDFFGHFSVKAVSTKDCGIQEGKNTTELRTSLFVRVIALFSNRRPSSRRHKNSEVYMTVPHLNVVNSLVSTGSPATPSFTVSSRYPYQLVKSVLSSNCSRHAGASGTASSGQLSFILHIW